jgi:hypothetical protein
VTDTDQEPRGKGRPTPKRADAQAARKKPIVAAKGKGGAKGRSRSRSDAAAARATMREALKTGDERNYPPMAAGPERALVRDVIDARRSFGWLAIPGWFVGVVLTLVPTVASRTAGGIVFPLVIGVIATDSVIAARAVGRALDERFPDGTDTKRGTLRMYAIVRNTQFRRQRLPRPRVARGEAT